MIVAVLGGPVGVLWHGAVQAVEMVWTTLWALVLGFVLSGAVRSVVSADALQRRLGDHSPRAVARATAYGAASSSCSYAAAAATRSMLARGADAVTAFVFMVASTNLVVELGAVILGLLGWRFLGAQLAGGLVLAALLAILGAHVLRGRALDAGRARLASSDVEADHCHGGHPDAAHHDAAPHDVAHDDVTRHSPGGAAAPPRRWRTFGAWSDAARAGLSDATMVRRELLVGFALAGLLAAAVPAHAWADVFLRGHGAWTTVENALVAPLVAMASCVCSVGNVPLAAVLWHGGIGFAGTLAFLFADVLALPLVLVYRRYFGAALTVRLVALLYVAVVLAALAVAGAASALGLAPAAPVTAPSALSVPVPWLTAALNVLTVAVAVTLLAGARRRAVDATPVTTGARD